MKKQIRRRGSRSPLSFALNGIKLGFLLFQTLEAALVRLLREAIDFLYLPVALGVGFLVGYLFGPEIAPSVMEVAKETFMAGFELSAWERICRWVAAVSLTAVGGIGYKRHQLLAKLRELHEYTYEHFHEIVSTPGSRLTDFFWAYLTAFVLVNVPVVVMLGIVVGVPLLITQNWLFRVLLIIFFLSGANTFLMGAANILLETFKPRRLEKEVQQADKIVPRLQREYERYLAEKRARESLSDQEVRTDDW